MRRALLLLAPLALAPSLGGAQSLGASRSVETIVENDLFSIHGRGIPADYDYTHGTRVGATWASAPQWIARAAHAASSCRSPAARVAGCVTSDLRLTQDIYTPRRDGPLPIPGERPYAGWLSLSAAAQRVTPRVVRSAEVELGITGRPSLAEQLQMDVHHLVATGPQLGWGHQLASRSAIAFRYAELRRVERGAGSGGIVAARLRWEASAGTALTTLAAGGDITVGTRANAPWSPAYLDDARPLRLFARVGAREDVVLRSAFIEGWTGGSAAQRRPFVAQGEAAVGTRWHRYGLEYRQVLRAAEYRAAPSPHPYGSLRLTVDGY